MGQEFLFADEHNRSAVSGTQDIDPQTVNASAERPHEPSLLDQGVQDELTDPEGVSIFPVPDSPTKTTTQAIHTAINSDGSRLRYGRSAYIFKKP